MIHKESDQQSKIFYEGKFDPESETDKWGYPYSEVTAIWLFSLVQILVHECQLMT